MVSTTLFHNVHMYISSHAICRHDGVSQPNKVHNQPTSSPPGLNHCYDRRACITEHQYYVCDCVLYFSGIQQLC